MVDASDIHGKSFSELEHSGWEQVAGSYDGQIELAMPAIMGVAQRR